MKNINSSFKKMRENIYFTLSHPAHFIAQGFFFGLSPIMPGTLGTLFSWVSYNKIISRWLFTPSGWLLAIAFGFSLGIWTCGVTERHLGIKDHGSIVFDEILAFWVVLLTQKEELPAQLGAFVIFRFFDIFKPHLIGYADRHLKDGFGIMWDDVMAGMYTVLALILWRLF